MTFQHRSSSSTIKSMPSSCTSASSLRTSAAVRLSPVSRLKSHPPRLFFCNDEVACQSRTSHFHCRCVYAGVGAEKLGCRSCPNRGPTAVSSSTLSHCPARVSSHAGLRHQLWISRPRILYKIIYSRMQRSLHQQTNGKCRGRENTQTENVANAIVQRCAIMTKVFWLSTRMPVPKQL